MEQYKKILWLIAARSGSKSIPDKNIKPLGGVPLLCYRIKTVLKFANPEDVWISTDSRKYADIAEKCGAVAPFLRPPELASDNALPMGIVAHAMQWADDHKGHYDAVGLLEPTSPFVKSSTLIKAVNNLFNDNNADSIIAVRSVRPGTFYIQDDSKYLSKIAKNIASAKFLRRQDEKSEITPSGGFYISKWESFKKKGAYYTDKALSYRVSDLEGLEIDEPIDWDWAEFLIEKKKIDLKDII